MFKVLIIKVSWKENSRQFLVFGVITQCFLFVGWYFGTPCWFHLLGWWESLLGWCGVQGYKGSGQKVSCDERGKLTNQVKELGETTAMGESVILSPRPLTWWARSPFPVQLTFHITKIHLDFFNCLNIFTSHIHLSDVSRLVLPRNFMLQTNFLLTLPIKPSTPHHLSTDFYWPRWNQQGVLQTENGG
jgi:hypothetical protein